MLTLAKDKAKKDYIMDYISSVVGKTRVASITEGKHIIHGKLKKNIKGYLRLILILTYM